MQKSIKNNTWVAPVIYFFYIIVADLLPITSQLISMVVVIEDVKKSRCSGTNQYDKSFTSDNTTSMISNNEEAAFQALTVTRYSTPPTNPYRYLSGKFLTNDSNETSNNNKGQ
jgi:hypothetical protein